VLSGTVSGTPANHTNGAIACSPRSPGRWNAWLAGY
jgi:hypothetical protein